MNILHTNNEKNILPKTPKSNSYDNCVKVIKRLGLYVDKKLKELSSILSRSKTKTIKTNNTCTGIHYSLTGLEDDKNISKPILKEKQSSSGQKNIQSKFIHNNHTDKLDLKEEILDWIEKEYSPTHFLTVQLPEHKKSDDYNRSLNHLRIIMSSIERKLLGRHWNKNHLPFICFAEHGVSDIWHFHILFNNHNFKDERMEEVISQVSLRFGLSAYCLLLEKIYSPEAISYCTKEIKVFYKNKIDAERIILSHNLFNVECKNPTNLISDVKKVGKDKS